MERTVYVKELNCEACEKLVSRIAGRHNVRLLATDYQRKTARLDGEDDGIRQTIAALNDLGYAASAERLPRKGRGVQRFINFISGSISGSQGYATAAKSFEVGLYSFIAVGALSLVLNYFSFLPPGSLFHSLLASFGIAIVAGVAWHVEAFKDYYTHMNGMMVGMVIGMTAGFLAGAVIGATNGMFVGSVVGMAAGMIVGAYQGSHCGIRGVLEGLMAGLMSGTMGAMLSVMMVLDHLNEFLAVLFISFAGIMVGLNYMVHKENAGLEPGNPSLAMFIAFALASQLILLLVIAFAPRSLAVIFTQ